MLEKLITEKTAFKIVEALLSDQNNIDIQYFKSVYELALPYLKKDFLEKIAISLFQIDYLDFFSPQYETKIVECFKTHSKDSFYKKYLVNDHNNLVLHAVYKSELPQELKNEYFKHYFNEFIYDKKAYPLLKQIYLNTEIKINNSNVIRWSLVDEQSNNDIHLVKDLFAEPKFINNLKELNAVNLTLMLKNLIRSKDVNQEELSTILNTSCFDKLAIQDLLLNQFSINNKTLLMYKHFNINVVQKLKNEGIFEFAKLNRKKQEFLFYELQKEENIHLFNEQDALNLNDYVKKNMDAKSWLFLRQMLYYNNQDLSECENFFNLSKTIFTQPNESIAELMIDLEKELLDDKLGKSTPKNKIKI